MIVKSQNMSFIKEFFIWWMYEFAGLALCVHGT